jgi:cytochrome b561
MANSTERSGDRLHFAVAALSLWLIATSPWIALLRRIPRTANWLDWTHVVLGFLTLFLTCVYAWAVTRGGRWRLIIPVLPPQLGAVRGDVGGLFRGRLPASESGGLFGLIEGLLLIALIVTGATGIAWYFAQGSDSALTWRSLHQLVSRGLIGLLVAHVVTVSLHLLEFARD